MSYRFEDGEPIAAGIRRIGAEQVETAVGALRSADDPHAGVHQARKCLKRVRAALRLVRDDLGEDLYRRENEFYRDRGRELAPLRDAKVAIDATDALEVPPDRISPAALAGIRGYFEERLERTERDHLVRESRPERVAAALEGSLPRIGTWAIGEDRFSTIEPGLRRVYRRGRKARRRAYDDPSAARFHDWRKRSKYLGYQLEILEAAWPVVLEAVADSIGRVSDLLGDAHDLANLAHALEREPPGGVRASDREAFIGLLEARRGRLRARARPLALRVWHESPDRFVDRMGAIFAAWREETARFPRTAPSSASSGAPSPSAGAGEGSEDGAGPMASPRPAPAVRLEPGSRDSLSSRRGGGSSRRGGGVPSGTGP